MKTKTKTALLGVLLGLAGLVTASATQINFGDFDANGDALGISTQNAILQYQDNDSAALVSTLTGDTVSDIYKVDVDGSVVSGSGFTNSISSTGGDAYLVSLVGTLDVSLYDSLYAVSKQNGSFEIYDLSSWNGTDHLCFWRYQQDFPPPTSASISHVAIYGSLDSNDPRNNVPDGGGTLMLLGLALVGIGIKQKFY